MRPLLFWSRYYHIFDLWHGFVSHALASSERSGKATGPTLTARKLLKTKSHDIRMSMRRVLRDFGLKVGRRHFERLPVASAN